MGRDKATLVVAGDTLAERTVARLARVCSEVLVADGGRGVVPGARSIADAAGEGPAAGILAAARERPGRDLLVLACDVPRVPAALLERLAETLAADGERAESTAPDLVLPRTEVGPEPLVGAYGPRALAALADQVASGENAVRDLLDRDDLRVVFVEGDDLARFGDPTRMLANVNTPTDLRLLEAEGLG